MNIQNLIDGVNQFNRKDAEFAAALKARAAELSATIASKAVEFNAFLTERTNEFNAFVNAGFADESESATEVRALFQDFLRYSATLDAEAARLRREATAFAETIDPPPVKPNDMTVSVREVIAVPAVSA